jgi:hypothetical protein
MGTSKDLLDFSWIGNEKNCCAEVYARTLLCQVAPNSAPQTQTKAPRLLNAGRHFRIRQVLL